MYSHCTKISKGIPGLLLTLSVFSYCCLQCYLQLNTNIHLLACMIPWTSLNGIEVHCSHCLLLLPKLGKADIPLSVTAPPKIGNGFGVGMAQQLTPFLANAVEKFTYLLRLLNGTDTAMATELQSFKECY